MLAVDLAGKDGNLGEGGFHYAFPLFDTGWQDFYYVLNYTKGQASKLPPED
jgi:hypothetical protein